MKLFLTNFIWFYLVFLGISKCEQANFYNTNYEQAEATMSALEYEKLSNASLLWGAYRSGLYFGVRPRIPRSLLSGLMWFNMDSLEGIGKIRHFYEQNDRMKKANWISYNPRLGGRMILSDDESHIDITIDFAKSEDGKSWAAKIKAKPHRGHENVKTSFVWYSGLEGIYNQDIVEDLNQNGVFTLDNPRNTKGYKDELVFSGVSETLGMFRMRINNGPKTNRHPKNDKSFPELNPTLTHHLSLRVPDDNVWRAKDIFMTMLMESVKELQTKYIEVEAFPPDHLYVLRDLQKFEGNVHFTQKIFEGECEFDVIYESSETPKEQLITSSNIESVMKNILKENEVSFDEVFKLDSPFNNAKYKAFAKEAISGLLGGLSYFYGDHLVDRRTEFDDNFESYKLEGELEGPNELFTFVPSRPFFPRGFYWDEGFHLLPLINFDSDLVLEVIESWFRLVDKDGWIAREQILGPESRSRVPAEFQVQSPNIVNPPTLIFVFSELLQKSLTSSNQSMFHDYAIENGVSQGSTNYTSSSPEKPGHIILNNPEILKSYVRKIYGSMKSHYEMFRRTQIGYVEEFERGSNLEAYRWRGRTVSHCLASGIDDYPRPLPADVAELNVDLLSWMLVMTNSMKEISRILNYEEDFFNYKEIAAKMQENLINIHWSEEDKAFCDVSVDDEDKNMFFCHKGYVSLFPFITKLIDVSDIDRIETIVDMISDPEELWSDFGIRSLSKKDAFYKKGEDYWRSPIWININSLILQGLKYYKEQSSQYLSETLASKISDTYRRLRINLVKNMYKEWKRTGFVWEQYDDVTGKSRGAKNFLGWSSNVVIVMSMPEII